MNYYPMTSTPFGYGTPLTYFPELEGKIEDKFYSIFRATKEEIEGIKSLKNWKVVHKDITENDVKKRIILLVRYKKNG